MSTKIRRIFLIGLIILIIFKGTTFIFGDFKSSKKVIIVDAGHGGKDPGAIGFSGSYEKDINIEISQKLEENLKSRGYKVVLTRKNDQYIDNIERTKLANKKRGRVFISIHGNSIEYNSSTNGIQVLYYPNRESTIGDLNNNELAQIMINSLIDGTDAIDKGIIERADLIVLNQTKMPAIIIECGFITNSNEEKLLLTDEYQNKIVDSIVKGIEEYFSLNLK